MSSFFPDHYFNLAQMVIKSAKIILSFINLRNFIMSSKLFLGCFFRKQKVFTIFFFQNFVKNNLRNLGKISGIFWVAFHKSRKSLSSLWATWSNNGVDVIFFSRSLVQFLGLTKHFSVSSTSAVEWIEPGFYSFLTVSFSLNFLFFKFSFLCLQRHLSSGHEVWFDKCCSENTKWSPT